MELNFHLFNCDRTYSLDKVEALICKVTKNLSQEPKVDQKYFALPRMKDLCNELNDGGKMAGYAVFVVHAHESRLSLNEENAGIGYAKLYRTLLSVTDGRVLIVIGGDDSYKENEHDESFLSKWAWRKICSQFTEDDINGMKSFIFSWDDNHNPIHEEALEFYLDPTNAGQKFVPLPKPKPTIIQQPNADDNELEHPPRPGTEQKQPLDQVFSSQENEALLPLMPSTSETPEEDARRPRPEDEISNASRPEDEISNASRDHNSTHQQEPQLSKTTVQEGKPGPRTPGPTEECDNIPASPSLAEGQEFDPIKGFLRYRAHLVYGRVNPEAVIYCDPPGWSPDKADLEHLSQRHADEPRAILEFWAESADGPTKPPLVKKEEISLFNQIWMYFSCGKEEKPGEKTNK